MKRIAVMVSGGGTNLQTLIDGCEKGEIPGEIVGVISSSRRAYALERAKKHGIAGEAIPKADFASMAECQAARHEALTRLKPDLIVLAGYLGIVPGVTVAQYPNAIINTHPALIPSFCGKGFYGLKVHQSVLDYGCKVSGCTIHFVDTGTDTGPIIFQGVVPVADEDTAESLQERVMGVEHRLLPRAVRLFCEDRLHVEGRKVTVLPKEEHHG
ncbi:phosphoribosylglycinamide formyltransferase [Gehongia tenuis]|uniref:Phosphoribosylglycinamide formyltransferase n=1 Tax=Gehongia tenuis TaxID=2763655 RepID=A0A926D7U3_9FIRM|nr:phosphoribosylglycinamide formyltransferase [Gehongia tenuis]MBC8531975.1 phosphoribosylglycinamide formyltransferase [Gehongia tenuis]